MKKKRILLFSNNEYLDRQVTKPADYKDFETQWKRQGGGNSGNKLFISAVEQYLSKEDIEYFHYSEEEKPEDIGNKYDLIVLPLANIFNDNPAVVNQLKEYTCFIEKVKIPVYILGCGIQCLSYDDIGGLASRVREPVAAFLKAVYQSGGELALRGYATKEFLDRIMPNTAAVTGCPSIYQQGSGIKISNEKVSEEDFKPVINGNLKYLKNIGLLSAFDQYRNSVYMDQDEFAAWLYFKKLTGKEGSIYNLIRKKTYCGARLLVEERVRLIYDIPVWINYLKEDFSFSCGTRIHGNIVATLAGVPAKVIYRDARTRELAEFMELPCRAAGQAPQSLYEEYLAADYTRFNQNFSEKFRAFERFMVSHGISHDLEDRSLFDRKIALQCWEMPEVIGEDNIKRLSTKIKRYDKLYRGYEKVLDFIRKK